MFTGEPGLRLLTGNSRLPTLFSMDIQPPVKAVFTDESIDNDKVRKFFGVSEADVLVVRRRKGGHSETDAIFVNGEVVGETWKKGGLREDSLRRDQVFKLNLADGYVSMCDRRGDSGYLVRADIQRGFNVPVDGVKSVECAFLPEGGLCNASIERDGRKEHFSCEDGAVTRFLSGDINIQRERGGLVCVKKEMLVRRYDSQGTLVSFGEENGRDQAIGDSISFHADGQTPKSVTLRVPDSRHSFYHRGADKTVAVINFDEAGNPLPVPAGKSELAAKVPGNAERIGALMRSFGDGDSAFQKVGEELVYENPSTGTFVLRYDTSNSGILSNDTNYALIKDYYLGTPDGYCHMGNLNNHHRVSEVTEKDGRVFVGVHSGEIPSHGGIRIPASGVSASLESATKEYPVVNRFTGRVNDSCSEQGCRDIAAGLAGAALAVKFDGIPVLPDVNAFLAHSKPLYSRQSVVELGGPSERAHQHSVDTRSL